MQKYDTSKMTELVGCSAPRLSQLRNGRTSKRKGKSEWTETPILDASDYEVVVENRRMRVYYFDSAVEKIKAYLSDTA
jgi:formylmethanofuran dehydrogenase subunit A